MGTGIYDSDRYFIWFPDTTIPDTTRLKSLTEEMVYMLISIKLQQIRSTKS